MFFDDLFMNKIVEFVDVLS